jgi:hypothetical protein
MRLTAIALLCPIWIALPCFALPGLAVEQQSMDPRFAPQPLEEACRTLTLASTGGPTLKDPKILAVR